MFCSTCNKHEVFFDFCDELSCPKRKELKLSRDRGCPCGREKDEYASCPRINNGCYKQPAPTSIPNAQNISPNERQPGGSHYTVKPGVDQHWDFMDRWDVSALEYAATKYIERIGKGKGTDLLDAQKARHYVEKIWHEHHNSGRPPRRFVPDYAIDKYLKDRELDGQQIIFFYNVLQWRTGVQLRTAIDAALHIEKRLLEEQVQGEAAKPLAPNAPGNPKNITMDQGYSSPSTEPHIDNTGQKNPFGYEGDK